MNVGSSQSGTIITFYSYKGGTGRSMAVANFACYLGKLVSNSSQRILVLDWDLEAPGLHSFFAARSEQPENKSRPGVINYFYDLHSLLGDGKDCYKDLIAEEGWKTLDKHLPLDDYVISDIVWGVDFIKAGRLDSQYGELVGSFDWVEFYNRYGSAIDAFRELLASKYAYCLIDSRTGLTDISGICTMLLPEKLVAVFTPNRQSLYGLLDLVSRAIEYRRASDDMRPLTVFPLPSRIDYAEHDLRQEWREEYQSSFEDLFRQLYEVDECNLSEYFNEVQLPHVSYYAYGEKIATLEERSEALSLRRAYEVFFQRLIELDSAWETPEKVEIVVREPLVEKELPPKSRISIGLEPPYGIIWNHLKRGEVIPFLGAGASLSGRPPLAAWDGRRATFLPAGRELARYLADDVMFPSEEPHEREDLAIVASYYLEAVDRPGLLSRLSDVFDQDYQVGEVHHLLADLQVPLLIITINYDDLIEQAFIMKSRPFHLVVHPTDRKDVSGSVLWWEPGATEPLAYPPNKLPLSLKDITIIYKMHGGVDRQTKTWDSFVITEEDHVEFLARMIGQSAIPARFMLHSRKCRFLFLGYGLRDWNLRVMLKNLKTELARSRGEAAGSELHTPMPEDSLRSWAIQYQPSALERMLWQARRVNIYDMEINAFAAKMRELMDREAKNPLSGTKPVSG